MRCSFALDVTRDYGGATPAIHTVVREFCAADWFTPVLDRQTTSLARSWIEEHYRLARLHTPDAFPAAVEVDFQFGGWNDFEVLSRCARTAPAWDWKFSALKPLCQKHSEAKGWRLDAAIARAAPDAYGPTEQGVLFQRVGELVIWACVPRLDVRAAVQAGLPHFWQRPARYVDGASWYFHYASIDVTHCIEWQLAEDSAQLEGNPFFPLLRCYGAGFLPFGVSRDQMVLFAFA